jgi:trans-aconitate methyltransferase
MNNLDSAWFNEDVLPSDMVKGATGEKGWSKLEDAEHFKVLNQFISNLTINKMVDIGCGAGELGRVLSNINYTGFDLPHIINKVSKIVNPNLNYIYFNADDFDYSILKEYDLLVCNSFISELNNPIEVLTKLIDNTTNYLLIHRQFFFK